MTDFVHVHTGLGLNVTRIGRESYLIEGHAIRVVGFWAWLACCIFGRWGIVVRSSEKRPMVLLDWETYCRMCLGLKGERIPDLTDGDGHE